MLILKRFADFLTLSRAIISFALAYLGIVFQDQGLILATILMLCSWTSDIFDGGLARRSGLAGSNWIGENDLLFDMLVSIGLLFFLMFADFVTPWIGFGYLLIWVAIFWKFGLLPSLGKLFQAPIYGWFILTAIRIAPTAGWSMVIFIICIVVITWPKFPQEVIPSFLSGWKDLNKK